MRASGNRQPSVSTSSQSSSLCPRSSPHALPHSEDGIKLELDDANFLPSQ